MNTVGVRRRSWPLYVIPAAVLIALVGMVTAGLWRTDIWRSAVLAGVIATSFVAALVGAVGGLILANTRRNVMWILAVSLSMTALLALLAIVFSSLAP